MILPIYRERSQATPEYLSEIAHVQRFLQRWEGDDVFRAGLGEDPQAAVLQYGLRVDPLAIRPIWDAQHPSNLDPSLGVAEVVQRYRALIREKFAHRDELRRLAPRAGNFEAWRRRQMVRAASQLGPAKAHGLVHPIVALELCQGCSVGCWFCGISAPRLDQIFAYDEAGGRLWRGVLTVLGQDLGPEVARQGFCYWATDPMDNPDYEKFCCDFHEILGNFPQTTTALAMRDPERTRRLLRLSEERGCLLNRFSVLTLKLLTRIHEYFSAEELAWVEMVMQIRKDPLSKAVAGRARDKAQGAGIAFEEGSTIACVSGFLINMVDRSVKLISPCPADQRWPLGYWIHGQGTFSDEHDFRRLIRELTSPEQMPESVRGDRVLRWRRDLQWELSEDGLTASSSHLRQTFRGLPPSALARVGESLSRGDRTASQLALELGEDLNLAFLLFQQMLACAVLDEEPEPVLEARPKTPSGVNGRASRLPEGSGSGLEVNGGLSAGPVAR